ncbi:DUF1877 family protein [Roseovarius sp. 2305UL8-3]|uniref:DUF1877 family protein n=1 Tax=Roseovarius conchicola TaxID=3121636 RepID=UPI00352888C1
MGSRTALYSVDRETIEAFIEAEELNFTAEEPIDLDKAAPILSHLIGSDRSSRALYYSDAFDLGDAALRGFLPEDVSILLRRLKNETVAERLINTDWDAQIAGKIYPFTQNDSKEDSTNYILHYGQVLEHLLTRLVDQRRGMTTVEV